MKTNTYRYTYLGMNYCYRLQYMHSRTEYDEYEFINLYEYIKVFHDL